MPFYIYSSMTHVGLHVSTAIKTRRSHSFNKNWLSIRRAASHTLFFESLSIQSTHEAVCLLIAFGSRHRWISYRHLKLQPVWFLILRDCSFAHVDRIRQGRVNNNVTEVYPLLAFCLLEWEESQSLTTLVQKHMNSLFRHFCILQVSWTILIFSQREQAELRG